MSRGVTLKSEKYPGELASLREMHRMLELKALGNNDRYNAPEAVTRRVIELIDLYRTGREVMEDMDLEHDKLCNRVAALEAQLNKSRKWSKAWRGLSRRLADSARNAARDALEQHVKGE